MFDVILDRDGILNVDVGYTYKVADFRFPDGTIGALQQLRDAAARFSIATGQSGIARGKYTVQAMEAFNRHLIQQLGVHGIKIAAIVFCPHYSKISGDCACRKPKTGMLKQIDTQIGPVNWSRAWGIGDKPSDSQMILAMGGSAVLVKSGPHNNTTGEVYWTPDDPEVVELTKNPSSFTAPDIAAAVAIIVDHLKQ